MRLAPETRIQRLSIALEALSRVNHYKTESHFGEVCELLDTAITEAKEKYTQEAQPTRHHSTEPDDEIPF